MNKYIIFLFPISHPKICFRLQNKHQKQPLWTDSDVDLKFEE